MTRSNLHGQTTLVIVSVPTNLFYMCPGAQDVSSSIDFRPDTTVFGRQAAFSGLTPYW